MPQLPIFQNQQSNVWPAIGIRSYSTAFWSIGCNHFDHEHVFGMAAFAIIFPLFVLLFLDSRDLLEGVRQELTFRTSRHLYIKHVYTWKVLGVLLTSLARHYCCQESDLTACKVSTITVYTWKQGDVMTRMCHLTIAMTVLEVNYSKSLLSPEIFTWLQLHWLAYHTILDTSKFFVAILHCCMRIPLHINDVLGRNSTSLPS